MLTPERMRRVMILTSHEDARALIEAVHETRSVHIIDHEAGAEDLDIGRPLPEGSKASERLVRLRSLLRHLEAEDHTPSRTFRVHEIEERLDATLDALEADVGRIVDDLADANERLSALEADLGKLAPLSRLPLNVEDYHGYENLTVLAGHVGSDPSKDVGDAAGHLAETFYDARSGVVAVFATKEKRDDVQNALFQHGFKEMDVPRGEGRPGDRARAIEGEMQALSARSDEARSRLQRLRADHGDFLRAAEEHLNVEVAKAEAPLAFAATEHAFVVEAWVPDGDLARVEGRLQEALGERIHFEVVPSPHDGHDSHGWDDIHGEEGPAHHHEEDLPPTKMQNGGMARPFEFFTKMFSTPKYGEIDPTSVLALAFPLFFGFMIADLGLGIAMVLLGVVLAKKLGRIEGMKELGFALALAGIIAALVGGAVFADAFGIPLVANEHMEHELHEHDLTLHPKLDGTLYKGHTLHMASCQDIYKHVGEPTWTCLLTGSPGEPVDLHLAGGDYHWPFLLKTFDVQTMLLISIIAGLVHLAIGLVFGVVNELHHDKKHAAAKVGWLILLGAFFIISLWLLAEDTLAAYVDPGQALQGAGIAVGLAALLLLVTEGGLAVIELPSMLSNLLSYLRLGAVAIGKGAMAIAFNKLTLVAALTGGGGAVLLLGIVGFLIAQMVLFVLGLLSAGIQAIRLNYVEFFTKFYKGGGQPFTPFGHVRQFTTEE